MRVDYGDNRMLLDLRNLMIAYLSAPTVDATLETSLRELGLTPAGVGPDDLPPLVERAMLGLRMFCSAEAFPELMLDLADYCHRMEV